MIAGAREYWQAPSRGRSQEPAIAPRFGVRGIPTLIAFEKGRVAKQHSGLVGLEFLRRLAH